MEFFQSFSRHIYLLMASLVIPWIVIEKFLLDIYEQLFKAFYVGVTESDYYECEKDHVDGPATWIEDLMVGLYHRGQLIVVHQHAYGKVNPTCRSDLFWSSSHPGKLNYKIDIL